jgi:hypothetical protein
MKAVRVLLRLRAGGVSPLSFLAHKTQGANAPRSEECHLFH